MHILVLDTIHGGNEIGEAFAAQGHSVVMVDVYRGTTPWEYENAVHQKFDLTVSPVHLDPHHLLLKNKNPVITHHEAVRMLLGDTVPKLMVEITGTRGKTTTAHALASLLPGEGVLHTSAGTYKYPGKIFLGKKSITPASVLTAVKYAREINGWLIVEESLGVTGAGTLAIITSGEDYSFASGKKSALFEKLASMKNARQILAAPGIKTNYPNVIGADTLASCDNLRCNIEYHGTKFIIENPLCLIPAYRSAIQLAAAAAVIMHFDPTPLTSFKALEGRMSLHQVQGLTIIDNSNSGTNVETTLCAARYARRSAMVDDLTLVIGSVEGDGAVCEGFSAEQIKYAISALHPDKIIWIGEFPGPGTEMYRELKPEIDAFCKTLEEGRNLAIQTTIKGSVVLAVKTWR